MRATECRQEIVEGGLIREVHNRELQSRLDLFFVEEIVIPDSRIEQIARCNAGRVVVGIIRTWCRNADPLRTVVA